MKRAIRYLPIMAVLTLIIFLSYKIQHFKSKAPEAPMKVIQVKPQRQEAIVAVQMLTVPKSSSPKTRGLNTHKPAKKSSVQVKVRSKAISSSGKKVLGNRSNEPVIVAEYGLPFERYLEYMRRLGAQVVVYDVEKSRFVCFILPDGTLLPNPSLKGYSPRARRLTSDFPNRERIFRQVWELFGPGDYEILLLLPQKVEERFFREIEKAVRKLGYELREVLSIRIKYEEDTKNLLAKIKEVEVPQGKIVLEYVVYLLKF